MTDHFKTALAMLAAFAIAGLVIMLVMPMARSEYEAEQVKMRAADSERSTRIWQRVHRNEQNPK